MSRSVVYIAILAAALILLILGPVVMAGGYNKTVNNVTNNYYEVTEQSFTITDGVSDKDLAEGIATAIAAGAHQFDFATFDWQGSVTAAFEPDENVDSVSFGIGKRWESIDALWHGGYTQIGDSDFVQIGATFRF